MAKSRIIEMGKKSFRYDYDRCVVEWVAKAGEEEIRDNEEWCKRHGKNLWEIDEDGYLTVDSIGLRKENWDDEEARREYLDEWIFEIDESTAYEMSLMTMAFV